MALMPFGKKKKGISRPVVVKGGKFKDISIGDQNLDSKFEGRVENTFNIVHEHHHHNNPQSQCQKEIANEYCQRFLDRAKLYYHKKLENIDFPKSEPVIMVVDMEATDDRSFASNSHQTTHVESLFGQDVERIQLEQLHNKLDNKPVKHVMILGKAGAGKSTLSKKYAAKVIQQNIDSLKGRELVIFVNVYDLQCSSKSTAFRLLFTNQMASDPETKLNPDLQLAGQEWMDSNSNKTVIIFDGLDQCNLPIGGKRYPKLDSNTKAKADIIIVNIMLGRIWPQAIVLTTSRWEVFWKLLPEYRSFKVTALRGFDEENFKNAAFYLTNDHSRNLYEYIQNSAPQLHHLCQNPLYLSYAAKVLEYQGSLPNTISQLMASVFILFMRSPHIDNAHVEDVLKLAFLGMMDNRFQFTIAYLNENGINYKNMHGILTLGAIVANQQVVMPGDKKYIFSHQCMQEFMAALYIINLDPKDVEDLIFGKLNEARLELMRKLFYGVMMDKAAFNIVETFLQDRRCSVEKCQQLLYRQMESMLFEGTISSIKLANLMSECGNDCLSRMKDGIKRINIQEVDIPRNDQLMLASMIKWCAPLDKVYVIRLNLDPELLSQLLCCKEVDSFEAGYHIMNSISSEHFDGVMELLDNTTLLSISLRCTEEMQNHFLSSWINKSKVSFDSLALYEDCSIRNLELLFTLLSKFSLNLLGLTLDNDITARNILEVTSCQYQLQQIKKVPKLRICDEHLNEVKLSAYLMVLQTIGCTGISFFKCRLTKTILNVFASECQRNKILIDSLDIVDKFLSSEGFQELSATLCAIQCKQLAFIHSDLSIVKLQKFGKACQDIGLEIETLWIADYILDKAGYYELAITIKLLKSSVLALESCQLEEGKLSSLTRGFCEHFVQLTEFKLFDNVLKPERFFELAVCLSVTGCHKLVLVRCDLSEKKLFELGRGCKETDWVIQTLIIVDKFLNASGYFQLAVAVKEAKCTNLALENCQLSKDKLTHLTEGFRENHVQIPKLQIDDTFLSAEGFQELVMTLCACKTNFLVFDSCDLSIKKLQMFGQACELQGCMISILYILDKYLDESGYYQLAITIKQSGCSNFTMKNCQLNQAKLSNLIKGFCDHHALLTQFQLCDSLLTPSGFHELAVFLAVASCQTLILNSCDLSAEKVSHLIKGCEETDHKITSMLVEDSKLDEDEYYILAEAIEQLKCSLLKFENCNLTKSKLSKFARKCEDAGVKLPVLLVVDENLNAAGYYQLALTIKQLKCSFFGIEQYIPTHEKILSLAQACKDHKVQFSNLLIREDTLHPKEFSALVSVLEAAGPSMLELRKCNFNGEAIRTFLQECKKKTSLNLKKLRLVEETFVPTNEVICALCELMQSVVEEVEIEKWPLSYQHKEELKKVLHMDDSKVKVLKIDYTVWRYTANIPASVPP